MARTRAVAMSLAILSILALSTLSFAAAADRITGAIASGQTVKLTAGVPLQAQAAVRPRPRRSFAEDELPHAADQSDSPPSSKRSTSSFRSAESALCLLSQMAHARAVRQRFGLSQNDAKKITDWLQSQGFTVVKTARGRNLSSSAAPPPRSTRPSRPSFTISRSTAKHFSPTPLRQ